eukprot:6187148-Pleurochrysis_carterae.AAC.2
MSEEYEVCVRSRAHVASAVNAATGQSGAQESEQQATGRTLIVDATFRGNSLLSDSSFLLDIDEAQRIVDAAMKRCMLCLGTPLTPKCSEMPIKLPLHRLEPTLQIKRP